MWMCPIDSAGNMWRCCTGETSLSGSSTSSSAMSMHSRIASSAAALTLSLLHSALAHPGAKGALLPLDCAEAPKLPGWAALRGEEKWQVCVANALPCDGLELLLGNSVHIVHITFELGERPLLLQRQLDCTEEAELSSPSGMDRVMAVPYVEKPGRLLSLSASSRAFDQAAVLMSFGPGGWKSGQMAWLSCNATWRRHNISVCISSYREGRGMRLKARAPKGEEPRPNANEIKPHETHPHQTGPRHTHTGQPRRPSNRQARTTSDHLSRGTREAAQRGPARRPSEGVRAGLAQGRVAAAQGDAELPQRPRDEGVLRETRAPSLHRVVCQGKRQRQRRGPQAPKRIYRQRHKGEDGDTRR
jgi:hypothetical protein